MLLATCEIDIGSCCLGDLLEKSDAINKLLEVDDSLELMNVVHFGYGRGNLIIVDRQYINDFLI